MPKPHILHFKYQRADVVAAQQLRYRNSPRLRVAFILGLAALAVILAQDVFPFLKPLSTLGNSLPLLAAIFFLIVPLGFYFIAPELDYRLNREWQHGYQLDIGQDQLRLASEGSSKWVDINLHRLRKILSDRRVFVFIFGGDQEFLILPKSILGNPGQINRLKERFTSYLPRKGQRRAPGK